MAAPEKPRHPAGHAAGAGGLAPPGKRINLQLLTYLDALMTERHVTRAADRVGIGQSAMSSALARLREIFHDPLLVRTTTGMQPTARGLQLARQVQDAMALIDQAARGGRAFEPATAEGHIRVLASEGVAQQFMPGIMARVRQQAPRLRFSVRPVDVRRTLEYLRDGEGDLVLGFVRDVPPSLHQTLLYPQDVVCIASRAHPAIRGKLSLRQFVAYPHVVWATGPVPYPTIEFMVDDALAARKLVRDVGLRVPNVLLSADVVAATDMLAVVPRRVATDACDRQGLALQILPLPFAIEAANLSMLWHERMHRDAAHTWLRGIVREVAAELRGPAA
ncbi:MAG: LysR family transcriptional regulator [Haliea sp.]|nr:MAG: LysR family transcriptional regulator [Haliea sp.]